MNIKFLSILFMISKINDTSNNKIFIALLFLSDLQELKSACFKYKDEGLPEVWVNKGTKNKYLWETDFENVGTTKI